MNSEKSQVYSKAFDRINLQLGKKNDFSNYKIMILGLGGVGSHAAIALLRSGFINLIISDDDIIEKSNTNRLIYSNLNNIGQNKTVALKEHLENIIENCNIKIINKRFSEENIETFNNLKIDFIVDAIDNVTNKIELIKYAQSKNIPIISAMGTGNRMDTTKLKYTTLYNTKNCPFARIIRKLARNINLEDINVVASEEIAEKNIIKKDGRHAPGSMIFVPGTCGYMLAKHVYDYFNER